MSWKTIDRVTPVFDPDAPPLLSEAVRDKIRSFFSRYESKRAVLLPALHVAQDALGHVPPQAMKEIADLLDLHPSDVLDTVSFYTHFWTHPKGKKVIVACRSISCEILGGDKVCEAVRKHLNVQEHGTTEDGEYSFMTEECLAGCDHAPCLLINEKLHENVKPENVPRLLADPDNDKITAPRSNLYDAPENVSGAGRSNAGQAGPNDDDARTDENGIGTTSDLREMRDSK